jgi:Family of unknown function (DUF6328)
VGWHTGGVTEHPNDAAGDPRHDAEWNRAQRDETPLERLDRNWADLLQELRVIQTGVQLLTGFLLILPFQSRFDQLSTAQQTIYLVTLGASVISTGFLIAPVSLHRFLFRRHARRVTVDVAHRLSQIGLLMLAVAMIGVVLLIFDVVAGPTAGWIAATLTLLMLAALWVALPLILRRREKPTNT